MSTLRLFLAVEINNDIILEKITQIQKGLGATKTKMTLVRPENLHLTLKFLGNTLDALVESAETAHSPAGFYLLFTHCLSPPFYIFSNCQSL